MRDSDKHIKELERQGAIIQELEKPKPKGWSWKEIINNLWFIRLIKRIRKGKQ